MKKEMLEAVKERKLYDFMFNNYWKMTKDDLYKIGREFIFQCEQYLMENPDIMEEVLEHLDDDVEEDEEYE